MSKIDDLIIQLCPDGIQYVKLGDVGTITIGEFVHKNKQNPKGKYPVYNGGSTYTGFYDEFNNTKNKIVISARGAAGFVNKVLVDYWAGNSCYSISFSDPNLINWLFIYYFLKENEKMLINQQQKGGIPAVSKKMVQDFLIPIPPLAIQEEIVNILDTFTTLEAELEAELEARKKQYTFYRDSLLSFEGKDVEWKTLGEACKVYTGGEAPENSIKGEKPTDKYKYPIYGNGIEVYGFTDTYRIDKDAVTISSIGANTGAIYYRDAYFTPIIRLKVVIPKNENLISKYLFYFLSSITINSKKSSVPNMNADDVKKIKIPIPTIAEQQRIVKILDKFDALVNDISIGLPAEIEARRKQYEYYRNQLLTFNNVSNE